MSKETLDENLSWLAPGGYDSASGNVVLCYQSYVVKTPHHNILVDSCIGNDKNFPHRPTWNKKNDPNWMNALKAAGLGVEDIDFVMCSHLHGDHVGWNTRLENGRWVPTFPKARYLFSKKEYAYWSEIHQKTPLNQITDSVLPIIEANRAELVTSDHELNDHIRLTPTPGHTPDHFAVCAGKGGDEAVFTGDLIHSPMQARYPELVMRVDTDRDQGVRTRRAFLRALLRHRHAVLHDALPVALGRPHQALGRRLPAGLRVLAAATSRSSNGLSVPDASLPRPRSGRRTAPRRRDRGRRAPSGPSAARPIRPGCATCRP